MVRSCLVRRISTPRTISSSVRRAQSSASRLVRKVLMVAGQWRRINAIQVPEGLFTNVAMCAPCGRNVPTVYRRLGAKKKACSVSTASLCFLSQILAPRPGLEPGTYGLTDHFRTPPSTMIRLSAPLPAEVDAADRRWLLILARPSSDEWEV